MANYQRLSEGTSLRKGAAYGKRRNHGRNGKRGHYDGEEYIVLIENDENADEVVILKINAVDEETEEYVSIEDDALLDTIFEKFKKKYEGEIDFA